MTGSFIIPETSAVGGSQAALGFECLGYIRQAVDELERANAERKPLVIIEHVCAALTFIASAARLVPDITQVFSDGTHICATFVFPLAETVCSIVGHKLPHECVYIGFGALSCLLSYPSDGLYVDRQLEIALLQAELSAFRFRRLIALRGHNLSRYIIARQTWDTVESGQLQ